MEIRNAIIKSAEITTDDRGFLDAWLHLDYGGVCQGFGGYVLYLPKSFTHHELKSIAGHFIFRCMEIAGASRWSELPGMTVRVQSDNAGIYKVGHIIRDDWFCPKDDFAST